MKSLLILGLAVLCLGSVLTAGCNGEKTEASVPVPGAPPNEKEQALQSTGGNNPEPFKERDLSGTPK